jgi:hypothetical protein
VLADDDGKYYQTGGPGTNTSQIDPATGAKFGGDISIGGAMGKCGFSCEPSNKSNCGSAQSAGRLLYRKQSAGKRNDMNQGETPIGKFLDLYNIEP